MTLHNVKRNVVFNNAVLVILLVWSLIVQPVEPFFRNLCYNELGVARIDPIMSPGQASQHVHNLHGASNIGFEVSADTLLASNCTNCVIGLDKSAYWAPAMYFQHEDGTYESVTVAQGLTVYYKLEKRVNVEDQKYAVFPKGFRMVAGHSTKRTWDSPWPVKEQSLWGPNETSQAALGEKAIGFNCLNYGPGYQNEATFGYPWIRSKGFVDKTCADGLRAEVLFPSCWDGENLDSPDHKSHVAYPTLLQDGRCPETHPVYLPIIFYETIFNTQDFRDVPGQFVMANGDPTGFGYHADFIAAWEDGALQAVMDDPSCTDHDLQHRTSQGQPEMCGFFSSHLVPEAEVADCRLITPDSIKEEQVRGKLAGLPGGMQLTGVRHNPGEHVSFEGGSSAVGSSVTIPSCLSTISSSNVSSTASRSVMQSPASSSSTLSFSANVPSSTMKATGVQVTSTSVVGNNSATPSLPSVTASPDMPIPSTTTFAYTSSGIVWEMVIVEDVVYYTETAIPDMEATPSAKPKVRRSTRSHKRSHNHYHGRV